ncbi:MAG: phosphate starvation-inducible protein PsiE [Bacteroidia bacterium]|nr:MAG: phosphate starvation-inducible protein PsiE [Bacteroidia bacterium]
MWEWIRSLPSDWQAGMEAPAIPFSGGPWKAIVTVGMGGSAFGSEVVRAWAQAYLPVPWLVVRDYRLPPWVGKDTLVLAASYSGNTEETLEATEAALQRGATVVGLASGGLLKAWGEAGKLAAFVELPPGRAPRAAVPFSITAQLRLLEGAGLVPSTWREESQALLKLLLSKDHPPIGPLKAYAQEWHTRLLVLYAPPEYEPIALRGRQQIQENAKHLAWHHTFPEMNHNEIVGWQHPAPLGEKVAFWLLSGSHTHPRNRLRLEFMQNLLTEYGLPYWHLAPPPAPFLAELMWLFHAVDIFSVYLAEKHEIDPTPVPVIDRLKTYLAQKA